MPKIVATHEVDDIAHWLASPKREEVFAGIATDIKTYVLPGDTNRVAVTLDVADLGSFEARMKSDAGAEAMKYDGVRPETVIVYIEK